MLLISGPLSFHYALGADIFHNTIFPNWVVSIGKGGTINSLTVLQNWEVCMGTMFINAKNVQIEVFLNINLNFTISVFTQGLTNDHNTCKKV